MHQSEHIEPFWILALVAYPFLGLIVLRGVIELSDMLLGENDAASLARDARSLGFVLLLMLAWPIGVAFLVGRLLLTAGQHLVTGGKSAAVSPVPAPPKPSERTEGIAKEHIAPMDGMEDPPVAQVVPRSGQVDLAFNGWLLASESCELPVEGFLTVRPSSTRVRVYATAGGSFVLALHSVWHAPRKEGRVHAEATTVALPEQVLEWLRSRNPGHFDGGFKAAWESASTKHPALGAIRHARLE